ncbi:unnamed protein product [Prorocentrum cordatum]|uniref:K Homology domain-containing protein n=1 Tax=Prorocentrum cordatum TaxID=2364126 RepID=A0ABN9S1T9_9DINO|nr:unnamed protein product [Polarella glacialis]
MAGEEPDMDRLMREIEERLVQAIDLEDARPGQAARSPAHGAAATLTATDWEAPSELPPTQSALPADAANDGTSPPVSASAPDSFIAPDPKDLHGVRPFTSEGQQEVAAESTDSSSRRADHRAADRQHLASPPGLDGAAALQPPRQTRQPEYAWSPAGLLSAPGPRHPFSYPGRHPQQPHLVLPSACHWSFGEQAGAPTAPAQPSHSGAPLPLATHHQTDARVQQAFGGAAPPGLAAEYSVARQAAPGPGCRAPPPGCFVWRRPGSEQAWQDGGAPRTRGPCFLKLLVQRYRAGAVIGPNGLEIQRMQQRTGCEITVSRADDTFPGTDCRMLVASGTEEDVGRFLEMQIEFLARQSRTDTDNIVTLNVVIPSSSASALIGRGGKVMQEMTSRTSCAFSITERVKQLQERILTAKGLPSNLLVAMREISRTLQHDSNISSHADLLQYDVDIEPGAWYRGRAEPRDPQMILVHPEDAGALTKHELLEYLRSAAPMGILIENGLMGKSRNVVKSKCVADIHGCVQQTWDVRAGQGPGRGPICIVPPVGLPLAPGLVIR